VPGGLSGASLALANVVTTTTTTTVSEGCTPGFWKNHPEVIVALGFPLGLQTPLSALGITTASGTIGQALDRQVGDTNLEKSLVRAAVAAILNALHPSVDYPLGAVAIATQVNTLLASGTDAQIETFKNQLDAFNNTGSDICD